MTPPLTEYLKEALEYIRQNSINREKLDWDEIWQMGQAEIATARTTAEVYPIIHSILAQLGDQHSFFMEPGAARRVMAAEITSIRLPQGQPLSEGIGNLNLPGVMGNSAVLQAYAKAVQQILQAGDQDGAKGWIIDLRHNTGGNMLPMLAGLGPLFGTDQLGSFVYPDGKKLSWLYRDGQVWVGEWLGLKLEEFFRLQSTLPPVAVLTGPQTASSGEIILIAFRGRPLTLTFGQATKGIPTCNDQYELSDGARINLTVAWSADRTGQLYSGTISPDQPIKSGLPDLDLKSDPVVKAAHQWLRQQLVN